MSHDDDLPEAASRNAASDPPLSLGARTPGPRGLARKIVLAALGLIVLAALMAVALVALRYAPRSHLQPPPPAQIEQR
jgi:hypothetical protein